MATPRSRTTTTKKKTGAAHRAVGGLTPEQEKDRDKALDDCWKHLDHVPPLTGKHRLFIELDARKFWQDRYFDRFSRAVGKGNHWGNGSAGVLKKVEALVWWAETNAREHERNSVTLEDAAFASGKVDCRKRLAVKVRMLEYLVFRLIVEFRRASAAPFAGRISGGLDRP